MAEHERRVPMQTWARLGIRHGQFAGIMFVLVMRIVHGRVVILRRFVGVLVIVPLAPPGSAGPAVT